MTEHYYQYDKHPRRHRTLKRFGWFVGGIVLASIIIIFILFLTTSIFVEKEQTPVTSGLKTSVQAPSIKVFRTSYFQFQTSDTWNEDAKATKDNTFVYRSYRGPLIEQDLTIYVNPSTNTFDATRIQPVIPKADGTLDIPGSLSDHCDTVLPKPDKDREQIVKLKGVTFKCDADDTIFDVLVGVVDGTPIMELNRPDGTSARYVVVYRDLTAQPTGRDLKEIVKSFQTR